ncbi:MAG TPA: lysoplasmalogenase [Candidatus Latescibacteria bacterium]|nr:lysoplasmalogenase [Candidatus Latescibacterota bacterium]
MAVPIPVVILSACVLLSAVLTIWSDAKGRGGWFYVMKPMTMVLVITVALIAATPVPAAYKSLVLAGLLCSLLGDIALMFSEKWFTAGLASFLAAHVFYVLAFKPGPGRPIPAGLFFPFIIFGLLMFRILAPRLGPMKFPVFVYIAAITVMAAFAAGRFVDGGGTRPLLAFAGAILFLISDSVLAYDRFAKKLGPAQVIILGTYFPAQLLIALSI